MDEVITNHLKNLTIKPRPTSWFKDVADDLGQGNTSNPKAAVRAIISKGQVAASNDNVQGLQQQVAKEKSGGSKAERDYARSQGVSPEYLHWIGDGVGAGKHLNPKLVHGLNAAALTGKIPFEVIVPEPITEGIRTTVKDKMRSEVPKSVRWMGLEKTGLAKSKAKERIKGYLPDILEDRGIEDYLVGKGKSKGGCSLNGYQCPLCH